MTSELLTESFCERCGTRYELGTVEPLTRTQKTRGLVTGLKAFIMSQDSLEDSITDAMRAEEEQLAARQIEVFQEAFNFCMDCRRYTCVGCWNDGAGRCRSCEPLAGIDDIAGFDERIAGPVIRTTVVQTPLVAAGEVPAWPEQDEIPTPLAAEVETEEPIAAEVELPEVELPEPQVIPGFAEPERVDEPIAASAAELEPEPEAPPMPFGAPKRDLRDTFARGPIVPRPAGRELSPETLAARKTQLDILGIDDPGEGTLSIGQRDALPYRSSGAGSAAHSEKLAAIWDASTRYLEAGAQRASIRPCGACGLTVSSTARFCRRCGAPQTLSA
jgi:hypothetical protein